MWLVFVTVAKLIFMWAGKTIAAHFDVSVFSQTIAAHFDVQGRNFNSMMVCSFFCGQPCTASLWVCESFAHVLNFVCWAKINLTAVHCICWLSQCLLHTYPTTLHYHTEGKRRHQSERIFVCTFQRPICCGWTTGVLHGLHQNRYALKAN